MNKDEALKLALKALGYHTAQTRPIEQTNEAITAIKEALVQDALDRKAENARELGLDYEPVAFASHGVVNWIADKQFQHEADLYTTPQRTWVGLTDEEIAEVAVKTQDGISPRDDTLRFAIAIEAKLKEKNT